MVATEALNLTDVDMRPDTRKTLRGGGLLTIGPQMKQKDAVILSGRRIERISLLRAETQSTSTSRLFQPRTSAPRFRRHAALVPEASLLSLKRGSFFSPFDKRSKSSPFQINTTISPVDCVSFTLLNFPAQGSPRPAALALLSRLSTIGGGATRLEPLNQMHASVAPFLYGR